MRRRAGGTRPLRVLQYEPSGLGGLCHYTYQLSEALAQQGCDVTLVTTSGYELDHLPRRFRTMFLFKPSRTKRLLTLLLPRRALDRHPRAVETADRDAISILRALRIRLLHLLLALRLLRYRPDIVHFQSTARRRDLPLVRLLKRLGFRVVCTAHDLLPHDSNSASERNAHAEIYRLVDRVIVHAESNRRELVDLFGVSPGRIAVIPHGSYDLLLPRGRMSKQHARAEIGLPRDAKVVLFFGLIKRYKGLEFLLQAFQRVEKLFPDAFLAVVGDIFRADSEGHAYYSRLVEEASRRENVHCVPRYVPVGEVGPYLSAADVIVLPYTKTYQSGVLLSAYAAGRPVVVTRTGGLPEIVQAGKTGFVVPPRDPDSLSRAIQQLFERPELAQEMGENASRLADTVYSWATIASSTVELYGSVMANRRETQQHRESSKREPPNGASPPPVRFGSYRGPRRTSSGP